MPDTNPNRLRKPLLIVEFSSLAVLLVSMIWFSRQADAGMSLNAAWLILPAVASLGVFLSFIGLMYLRWVGSANAPHNLRHKLVFSLLAVTLLGIWVYSIVHTWLSITATS